MADVFLKLNRLEDARKALLHALELNPAKGECYKGLAQIAGAQGDQAAYEDNLSKAVQYLRDDPWVAEQWTALDEQKNPQDAILKRQKNLEASPQDTGNMARLALLLEGQKQIKEATALIERAQKMQPKDASLALLAANYWQRQKDPARAEKALLDLTQVVDADQKVNASLLLARLYKVQGLPEKAEQTFNVAAKQAPQLPGPYLELADLYRGQGRIDDAVKSFRQALAIPKKDRGEDGSIRQLLVETLLQSRKLEDASKEIDAYHQAMPDDPIYQLMRGTLLMLQGHAQEAISTLDTYLQREPNSAPARYHRGLLYVATNRLPQAIDDLSLAKQLSPTGFSFEHRTALAQAYEANGQPERAITELNEIISGAPPLQTGSVAMLLAKMYQRANRTNEMEVLIRKYMELLPKDGTWAKMLGGFGEMTGNYAIAVQGYTTAALASGFQLESVDKLLEVQIAAKKYDQAIDYIQKTVPEAGRAGAVKARLAQAMYLQGNRDRAKALFGEAVAEASKDYASSLVVARVATAALGRPETTELLKQRLVAQPDSLVIKYMLVAMLAEQEQWDTADALSAELAAAARSNEEKFLALKQRGSLLYRAGKHQAASVAFEDLLKVVPDDFESMNNLAYILAEDLARPQEALRYAKRAVELRPRDANVIDTLGWVYYLAGDTDSAVGSLVSALQYSPNNIAARYHVAMAYKKQGKMDQAKRDLALAQQEIEKAPQDPIAQMFQDRVKVASKELSGLPGAAGK